MPGAALDTVDGDNFTGTVKVKLGPIAMTYKGKASFTEKDEATHRATINAQGRDARGNGTAAAKVTATLTAQGDQTKVQVLTDLDVTGKPAQFGRGVITDVGNKLIGQFADNLARRLVAGTGDAPADSPAPAKTAAKKAPAKKTAAAKKAVPTKSAAAKSAPAASAPADDASAPTPAAAAAAPRHSAEPEVEPIDLLESVGPAVAKRLIPVAAAAALVLLLIILRLRKR
jgi:carbon monoxide dehydrogenase subunit G